jgi:hypothetical protein
MQLLFFSICVQRLCLLCRRNNEDMVCSAEEPRTLYGEVNFLSMRCDMGFLAIVLVPAFWTI